MARDERLCRRATRNGLHHRSLDFDKSPRVQETPNLADDLAAFQEYLLHLVVGHQIEVTLAIADFGVFQAVPFGRRRPQRLGDRHE